MISPAFVVQYKGEVNSGTIREDRQVQNALSQIETLDIWVNNTGVYLKKILRMLPTTKLTKWLTSTSRVHIW